MHQTPLNTHGYISFIQLYKPCIHGKVAMPDGVFEEMRF